MLTIAQRQKISDTLTGMHLSAGIGVRCADS